ncbi:hypothetical protein STTU_5101 [Streptomyces sp. Tu6071]|nr:hypothetical protein STTU_5101 [Streptomyces sp. Tu6071]
MRFFVLVNIDRLLVVGMAAGHPLWLAEALPNEDLGPGTGWSAKNTRRRQTVVR